MKDFVEEHARGAVEIEVVNYEGDEEQLRAHLYKQFGAGTSGDIHTKETEYDAGLPDKGQKQAFPKGVDMKAKLRQLNDRRQLFWKMCAPEKRANYPYCHEVKLVRIVLEYVDYNDDYKECIARLLTSISLKKEINAEWEGFHRDADMAGVAERSFNDDWLPTWKQLRSVLEIEYVKLEKGKTNNGDKSGKIPVAMFGGEIRCYSCGVQGHKKGDQICKAGRNDIHPSAPQEWKKRQATKFGKQGGSSGGGSNANRPASKKPCHQFNFGKGQCSYGNSCKFAHETSSQKNDSGGGAKQSRFSPSQKKQLSAMVASSLKKVFKNASEKSKKRKSDEMSDDGDGDCDLATIIASCMLLSQVETNTIPRTPVGGSLPTLSSQLHNVQENVGIDSDSALTISCFEDDFIWLDKSPEALAKVPPLHGIGGGESLVAGVGPCLVRKHGTGEYLLDPEGVYLKSGDGQPMFRVLSQLRFKALGVRLVSCWKDTDDDSTDEH